MRVSPHLLCLINAFSGMIRLVNQTGIETTVREKGVEKVAQIEKNCPRSSALVNTVAKLEPVALVR